MLIIKILFYLKLVFFNPMPQDLNTVEVEKLIVVKEEVKETAELGSNRSVRYFDNTK